MRRAPEAVADFVEREAALLDERRFRDWLALFAADAYYWVPASPGQESPQEGPSHIFERRPVLDARVERLFDPRAVPQLPPSRTNRLLGVPRIAEESAASLTVRVPFHLVEFRVVEESEWDQRVFAGTASMSLARTDAGFSIRWKRVDLINADAGLFGVSILL